MTKSSEVCSVCYPYCVLPRGHAGPHAGTPPADPPSSAAVPPCKVCDGTECDRHSAAAPLPETSSAIEKGCDLEASGILAELEEFKRAIQLAHRMLDRHSADPDDDLAVLSRQLLRVLGEI